MTGVLYQVSFDNSSLEVLGDTGRLAVFGIVMWRAKKHTKPIGILTRLVSKTELNKSKEPAIK